MRAKPVNERERAIHNKERGCVKVTIEQRNQTFEEYQRIIGWSVNRHRSMLAVMKMEAEDLMQELSICLLLAIERYDPTRGAKASTYYFTQLRYGVLKIWQTQIRKIRLANMLATPLVCKNDDGEETTQDVPYEVDYDTSLLVEEFMETLSWREREVLSRKMDGYEPDDIRTKRFMGIIKKKARRFCAAGGLAYA